MKRIIRYMQDQAIQASEQKYTGPAYLSPREKEPQHQYHHHGPSYQKHSPVHNRFDPAGRRKQQQQSGSSADDDMAPNLSAALHHVKEDISHSRNSSPSSSSSDPLTRDITRHQYASDNIWQSYEIYIPQHASTSPPATKPHTAETPKFWILYIHGGYFRDDSVTAASFHPALAQLVKHPRHGLHLAHLGKHSDDGDDISPYIAGYASINYRLSPRPERSPQGPKTPEYELRNAQWPEHIHDVLTAIAHLQSKYGFGDRYLLVGHSVGATMALLSTLAAEKSFTAESSVQVQMQMPKIEPPLAVLAVSGIYDFALLHASNPNNGYEGLTSNAIRRPEDVDLASPTRYSLDDFENLWAGRGGDANAKQRALIVAHSRDDGLVDWKQVEAVEAVFAERGRGKEIGNDSERQRRIKFDFIEVKGLHNDIWREGTMLAKAIRRAVGVMRAL